MVRVAAYQYQWRLFIIKPLSHIAPPSVNPAPPFHAPSIDLLGGEQFYDSWYCSNPSPRGMPYGFTTLVILTVSIHSWFRS